MSYSDGEELKLDGVLFVPTLKVNIVSLGKLDDDGFTSTLGGGILSIFDNKGNVFSRIHKSSGSMYHIKLSISEFYQITREEEEGVWLWHHRLCHQSFRAIDDMRRSDMVSGLPKRLQLIHGDICGPIKPSTVGGPRIMV